MGNSQSDNSRSNPTSPNSPVATRQHQQHVARRKESTHALSHVKSRDKDKDKDGSGVPPTASLISTSSSASTATQPTRAHAHATVTPSPGSHSRARSIASGTGEKASPAGSKLKAEDSASSQKSDSSVMGSDHSKNQRQPPARASPLPTPATPANAQDTAPKAEKPPSQPSPAVQPVDVPQSGHSVHSPDRFFPSGLPASGSPYGLPPSNYSRPPRLPLPIEEEVHTPGSPIITPHDVNSPVGHDAEGLQRRSSVLSSTTMDEEETDNDAYTATADQNSVAPSVPTVVEWHGPGNKIFVTGTFVQWDRKFKLHRDKEKGGFHATLQLRPGTHHLKFLVDGDMITSNDLPTTVDYTNILVNYIEVVAPLPTTADKQPTVPAEPMPIPGAAIEKGQATGTDEPAAKPLPIRSDAHAPETESTLPLAQDSAAPTPQAAQPTPIPDATPRAASPRPQQQDQKPQKPPREVLPRPKYTNTIPQFLLDLDTYQNPQDERFQRSSRVINELPQPPSLPMFLSKSILNGTTPHKDDASVLIMPNHTVLNHLATSSIKSGVLATSGTTRYKRKFLTTIMYKPTSDDGS